MPRAASQFSGLKDNALFQAIQDPKKKTLTDLLKSELVGKNCYSSEFWAEHGAREKGISEVWKRQAEARCYNDAEGRYRNKKNKKPPGTGLDDPDIIVVLEKERKRQVAQEESANEHKTFEQNQGFGDQLRAALSAVRWKKQTCLTFLINLKDEELLGGGWNKPIEEASALQLKLNCRFADMGLSAHQPTVKEESEDARGMDSVINQQSFEDVEKKYTDSLEEGPALSDETRVAGTTWAVLKVAAMEPGYTLESEDYADLEHFDRVLVGALLEAQRAQGDGGARQLQGDRACRCMRRYGRGPVNGE